MAVAGTGAAVPERVLTNDDLVSMVETSDEWIRSRTGIVERRVIEVGSETVTDLAVRASEGAVEMAGVDARDLDLVICATCTPDFPLFPATAPLVASRLGADRAGGFDLSLACTGFVAALITAEKFVATGAARNALVIGVDAMSPFTDFQDRTTCVIFADGAGAAVVRPAGEGEGAILYGSLGMEGNAEVLCVPAGGAARPASAATVAERAHFIRMDGRSTFKFAVRAFVNEIQASAAAAGVEPAELDLVIPHQVNLRIIEMAARKLSLDMERVVVNIDRYGNTSGGSVPIALDEAVRAGRLARGDLACLVAFGAGLAWGSVVLRW